MIPWLVAEGYVANGATSRWIFPFIRPGDPDWRPRYASYNRPGEYLNGGMWPCIAAFQVDERSSTFIVGEASRREVEIGRTLAAGYLIMAAAAQGLVSSPAQREVAAQSEILLLGSSCPITPPITSSGVCSYYRRDTTFRAMLP